MSRLVLLRGDAVYEAQAGDVVVPVAGLRQWAARLGPLQALMRYAEATIVTPELCHAGRPFALALLARCCARGSVWMVDEAGARRKIVHRDLVRWLVQVSCEPVAQFWFLAAVRARVEREWRLLARRAAARLDWDLPVAYLRTDLSFNVRAGGSVGHIGGVINSLFALGLQPVFITTDRVPTVDPRIPTHLVCASERFWSYRELPAFVMDDVFGQRADQVLSHGRFGFIYQRSSLNNFAGVRLSRAHRLPLVVEYNGSEVWVSRHWGAHALRYEALATRIEDLNFAAADLIVVVSEAIRDQLAERGVDTRKILVNPNGVDLDRYAPDIDGSRIRGRYGFETEIVLGFIGTFGLWHGAEVLAQAYVRLLDRRPDLAARTRLLYIGDGPRLARTREIVATRHAAEARTIFTGLVPQADGPAHLAACDLLVSPHVPNADGTPFFGSPTKLFEYMAMGRPIVASDLDQIGQVLRHRENAWLVAPNDADALARGLEAVIDDAALGRRLGAQARQDAVARHSWRAHTQRILDALAAAQDVAHRPVDRVAQQEGHA